MTKKVAFERLLITVTGRDQPGITAEMAELLEASNVDLLDVEQVVVQGKLILRHVMRRLVAGFAFCVTVEQRLKQH